MRRSGFSGLRPAMRCSRNGGQRPGMRRSGCAGRVQLPRSNLVRSRPMSGRSNSDWLENESGMVENVGVAVRMALLFIIVLMLFDFRFDCRHFEFC